MSISVTQRLAILVGLPLIVIGTLVASALAGFSIINQNIGRIYDDRVVPLTQLKNVSDAYVDMINIVNKADNGLILPSDAVLALKNAQEQIDQNWRMYKQGGGMDAEKQNYIQEVEGYFAEAAPIILEARNILSGMGDMLQFDEYGETLVSDYNGDLFEYVDPITQTITTLIDLQLKIAAEQRAEAQSVYDAAWVTGILVAITSLLVVGSIGFLVSRSINLPLASLRNVIETVESDKNLRVNLPKQNADEIGKVATSFKNMINELAEVMAEVCSTTESVRQEAANLQSVTQETQRNAAAQLNDTQVVAESSQQMAEAIDQVSTNAEQAKEAADEAMQAVQSSQGVVNSTRESVDRLQGRITDATEIFSKVQQDSESITTVLDVIRGISEQTNLLALNAAIEAARAGEQGRGFAVVADEVRALAVRTQDSTEEIQSMIDALQQSIKVAATTISDGQAEMSTTQEQASQTHQSLETITSAVSQINAMSKEIALSTQQQNTTSQNISSNIGNIANTSNNTQSQIERANDSSQLLLEKAEQLEARIHEFKF